MDQTVDSESLLVPPAPRPASPPPPEPGEPVHGFFPFLDTILRSRENYFWRIFRGQAVLHEIRMLLLLIVALTALYGVSMGVKSGVPFMLASAAKTPLLFLLTLAVCYPVLYVINVLMGSKLGFLQTLALILAALAMSSILLASFALIVLFFTLTGTNYHFLKLLHVGIFGFSGMLGMVALWRGLTAACEHSDLYPRQAMKVLRIWIIIFGFVGAQMAWSLRPFVGSPGMPFEIFRAQEGNFYAAVIQSVMALMGR